MDSYNVVRIAFLGPSTSGKSSLVNYLATGEIFEHDYIPTIGANVKYKILPDKNIKLLMWDLSGDPRFSSIYRSYVQSMPVIFLCYDSSDYTSYQKLIYMYKDCKHLLNDKTICIVSLKNDSYSTKFKYYEWGRDLSVQLDCPFLSTSVYLGNVNQILQWATDYIKLNVNLENDLHTKPSRDDMCGFCKML